MPCRDHGPSMTPTEVLGIGISRLHEYGLLLARLGNDTVSLEECFQPKF